MNLHGVRCDGSLHEAGAIGLTDRQGRFDAGGCASHGAVAIVVVAGVTVENGGEGGGDEEDEDS